MREHGDAHIVVVVHADPPEPYLLKDSLHVLVHTHTAVLTGVVNKPHSDLCALVVLPYIAAGLTSQLLKLIRSAGSCHYADLPLRAVLIHGHHDLADLVQQKYGVLFVASVV